MKRLCFLKIISYLFFVIHFFLYLCSENKTFYIMRTSTIDLQTEKLDLISSICDIDNISIIKSLKRSLNRTLAKEREAESEEYISKEEILAGIRQGLLEVKEAREKGIKLMDARDLINEL